MPNQQAQSLKSSCSCGIQTSVLFRVCFVCVCVRGCVRVCVCVCVCVVLLLSWLAEDLLASQEGLSSLEQVR